MEKRNKLWRKRHQWRLFKSKMILFASNNTGLKDKNRVFVERPHWFEFAEQKWCYVYKTTRCPCSCCYCKGERYNRRAYKKEAHTIINCEINE